MTPHRILKSFKGSQTGHDHHTFEAGTTAHLSKDLAKIVVKEGWAEPHIESKAIPVKAIEGKLDEVTEITFDGEPISEEKSLNDAPANKALKAAPANKSKK